VAGSIPVFRETFKGPQDEFDGRGVRPVVFDILSPDREFSILPAGIKLVLHVNPQSMKFSYTKIIERIQTRGGFVEQHWGRGANDISFEMVTGGFMRLHTGLISMTGGGLDLGGTRRDTIAYDKYLDLLATFKNNGAIFDANGNIILQGIIKCSFDGSHYFGWFESFSVSEEAASPYQFKMSTKFTVDHEVMGLRSVVSQSSTSSAFGDAGPAVDEATPVVAEAGPASALASVSPSELPGGTIGFTSVADAAAPDPLLGDSIFP
jgi:hypothetical protein